MDAKDYIKTEFPEYLPRKFENYRAICRGVNSLLKQEAPKLEIENFLKSKFNPELQKTKREFPDCSRSNPIIASNKPFAELKVSKLNAAIQELIFNAKENDETILKCGLNKTDHIAYCKNNNINITDYYQIQTFNSIFKNALEIRKGLFVKAENKNIKINEKNKKN